MSESTESTTEAKAADQGQLGNGDVKSAGAEEGKSTDNRTDYMVLYAPVPEDPEHRPRYREAGYVRAHDGDHVKRLIRVDEDNPLPREHLAAIADAAERNGVLIRSVPIRSWPAEVEPSRIKVERSWVG